MAHPNKDLLIAWSSLLGDESKEGWRFIPLQQSGPLQIMVGRTSPHNMESVLIGFPNKRKSNKDDLPSGQGFLVEFAQLDENNNTWLAITRSPQGNIELFESMSYDVVNALDEAVNNNIDEEKLYQLCISRIRAWQEFMRKGGQVLSPESEIGLFGELILLKSLIDLGLLKKIVLDSWVGPLNKIQDFELGTGAIEVKSTISSNRFQLKIGSLEQLDDSIRQPLYIAAIRLHQIDAGVNLTELIFSIKNLLSDDRTVERIFSEKLLEAGYIEIHAPLYIRKFKLAELKIISIDNNFPRLLTSNVPKGIIRATYDLDLDKILINEVEIFEMLQKLGVS